ncbi:MAG: thiamine phosphate synthase [Campylobacteraceae bacterium]|nr:thiamine phosphate synthase [Campylobacteraceae bacterium]
MKLYALIDKATLIKKGKSLEEAVKRAKSLNASLLQYRNKTGAYEEKKEDLLTIKSLYADAPIIINDDLALIAYCGGIHLGQEDILKYGADIYTAAEHVREIIGSKIFGISTHNKKEILEANKTSVDYIGLGAYRKTDTKDTNNILGDTLDLLANFSEKPVAAIGGVKLCDRFEHVTYLAIGSGLYEDNGIFG